jgi:hypothetical protein
MSDLPSESSPQATVVTTDLALETPPTESELKEKYVKYAMRNMVKKRGKSLQHFALSTIGLLGLFIGLSYLTR